MLKCWKLQGKPCKDKDGKPDTHQTSILFQWVMKEREKDGRTDLQTQNIAARLEKY
jgi:hypothetical protein